MISEQMLSMMGTKIRVLRGYAKREQCCFPHSKKKRIRKEWAKRNYNWCEYWVPPPIADDEFIVMPEGNPSLSVPFNPLCKDASQSATGRQIICCMPAGEATLRRELGVS